MVAYEAEVDIAGVVVAADVRRRQFTLQANARTLIQADLRPEYEAQVLAALQEHAAQRLRVQGRGEFDQDGHLRRITQVAQVMAVPQAGKRSEPPIWEVLLKMADEVPDEEAAKLPADLAENLDHYLYGAPKQ
jgi:hypothetical protein